MSDVLSELGYIGLALLMVAETVFPPIPSEVVLPLAGYLVFTGELEFVPALIASTVGSLVGAVALEEAARYGGRPFAERFVHFAHQDPEMLERAERWFQRRGPLMVLVGRCIPGVRSLVALPAGAPPGCREAQYVAADADRIRSLEHGLDHRRVSARLAMGTGVGRHRSGQHSVADCARSRDRRSPGLAHGTAPPKSEPRRGRSPIGEPRDSRGIARLTTSVREGGRGSPGGIPAAPSRRTLP